MTLYMIGIGLGDEKGITLRGLEAIKSCNTVFLEDYTSKLTTSKETLEQLYKKEIVLADRELVEKNAQEILENAKTSNVAFLVVGDVFGATTHTDLYLRAKKENIKVEIVHNTSIINAVSSTGLELYKFGKTTSLPYWADSYKPTSTYDDIQKNQSINLHTLVLLDIKADENKYMTVNQAIELLLKIEDKKQQKIFTTETLIIGCARLSANDQKIVFGSVKQLLNIDFGAPLHSLIIPSKLHFIEEEMIEQHKIS
ncbi:diphthine synthase [Candidatus Woesearchaeota archaeon]|nr:diphthine synthase [Candidatus Woesearchaeota archaeon]